MTSTNTKEYRKEYYHRPENKAKEKEYRQRPEVKARKREYAQRPEAKAKIKEYLQRPEVKARLLKRRQRPEVKAKEKKHKQKPEIKSKIKEYQKEYQKEYFQRPGIKDCKNLHNKDRRKDDTNFRIKINLRSRLYNALRSYTKTGKIMRSKDYGINYKAIINHLKPFPKDSHLYHVDHIKPLFLFNLEDPEEVIKAFAPSNHQWLLAEENLIKGCRY